MSTLAFPAAEKTARLFHPHRHDIWGRALAGFVVRRLNVVAVKDMPRRLRCERDFALFKSTYFPKMFTDPCSYHDDSTARKQAATLLRQSIVYQDSEAAPRSIGKTTDCRAWVIWAILYGHTDFALFLTLNGEKAEDHIKAIKSQFLTNELLYDDFPDLCGWVRSFSGDPRRCKIMYPGQDWNDTELHFPNGAWVCAAGMDSALPGMNKDGKRPKLIIFEDPEDLKIATSTTMRKALHDRIFMEALKLHDTHHKAIYWFVCTIYAHGSVADEITNPKLRPEWRGRRYRALSKWPERMDLVETFAALFREQFHDLDKISLATPEEVCAALGMESPALELLTPGHQRAMRFYVANKAEIERGAEVLDPIHLPLHRCLEEFAKDPKSFAYQYQNDPPDDENKKTLQLDVEYLLTRRIGEGRGLIPAWGQWLTASIDVGAYVLHWEVDAWDAELRTSCLIDQGQQETNLNAGGEYKMSDVAEMRSVMVRDAVQAALMKLRLQLAEGYSRLKGDRLLISLVGVDCGGTADTYAWYETILKFCKTSPQWMALKGERWTKPIADRALGRNWICEQNNNPGLRHDCNADWYKRMLADAYNAPPRSGDGEIFRGARVLHRDTPQIYATHQTSEYWIEQIAKDDVQSGKELKLGWNKRSGVPNHWWDTGWMAYALADILKVVGKAQGKVAKYGIVGKAW